MSTKTLASAPAYEAMSVVGEGEEILREEIGGEQEIADEAIARRAYEISLSGQGGSDLDNWLRAEGELRQSI